MRSTHRNFRPSSVANFVLLILCLFGVTTQSLAQKKVRFGPIARAPEAIVAPITFPGSISCATLNASPDPRFSNLFSDNNLTVNSTPPAGTSMFSFAENNDKLTITRSGNSFNFTADRSIMAVIVRDATDSNVYPYNPATNSDTNLVSPNNGANAISSVSFCYGNAATITIIKRVFTDQGGTVSTVQFPFTATANFGVNSFSLVDQDVVGPDRITDPAIFGFGTANTIRVTENVPMGWTLTDIDCVVDEHSVATVNLGGGFVDITPEDGEPITCVFSNTDLRPTAADSSISGRVVKANGIGIGGAQIIVTNAFTGETRAAITNPFGYYSVDGLESGFFYFVKVSAKRVKFAESVKTVTLNDSLTDMDFVANP